MLNNHQRIAILVSLFFCLGKAHGVRLATVEEIAVNSHCNIELDENTYVFESESEISVSLENFVRSVRSRNLGDGPTQCQDINNYLSTSQETSYGNIFYYDDYFNNCLFDLDRTFWRDELGCKKTNFLLLNPTYRIDESLLINRRGKIHLCGIYRENGNLINSTIISSDNIDALHFVDTDVTFTNVDVLAPSLAEGRTLVTSTSTYFDGIYELKLNNSNLAVQSAGVDTETGGDTLRVAGCHLRGGDHVLENHAGGSALKLNGRYDVDTTNTLFNLSRGSIGISDQAPGNLKLNRAYVQSQSDNEPSKFYVQEVPAEADLSGSGNENEQAEFMNIQAKSTWDNVCVSGSWSVGFTFNQESGLLYDSSTSGDIWWLPTAIGTMVTGEFRHSPSMPLIFHSPMEGNSDRRTGREQILSDNCPFPVTQTRVVGSLDATTRTTTERSIPSESVTTSVASSPTNSGLRLGAPITLSVLTLMFSLLASL